MGVGSTQGLTNGFEYTVWIRQHLVVPESEHTITSRRESGRSFLVGLAVCVVLAAIDLDDEAAG